MLEEKEVMIVEDDLMLSQMYEERIRQEGASVATVSNGSDAIPKILESHPNIVLLDLMMPGTNGLDVLKELKSSDQIKDIPVIVFSALNDENKKSTALELGAAAYLVKSEVLPIDVVGKIKELLGSK